MQYKHIVLKIRKIMKNARGYTLIEIIIVTGVMLLLVGGGIAAYFKFQERQGVLGAANELKVYLRSAQTRASSGDKPELCDRLLSYAVRTVGGTKAFQMVARCEDADTGDVVEFSRKDGELQGDNVVSDDSYDVEFLTLHGGVVEPATILVHSESGVGFTFDVTSGGEITKGEFVEVSVE